MRAQEEESVVSVITKSAGAFLESLGERAEATGAATVLPGDDSFVSKVHAHAKRSRTKNAHTRARASTHALSLSHTHTHTYILSLLHTLTHTQTLSLSHAHTCTLSLSSTHTHARALANVHELTHTVSLALPLSPKVDMPAGVTAPSVRPTIPKLTAGFTHMAERWNR